jgi:DNA-binding response OmpR family regulator
VPRILIADDDPTIRSLIHMTLDTGAFEIAEVEDGVTAITRAHEFQPHLIFLDWSMPGLSGIEVCKTLRADPETAATKILILTARSQADDRLAGLAAGAADFITKPFSPLALLDKVAELLGPEALL